MPSTRGIGSKMIFFCVRAFSGPRAVRTNLPIGAGRGLRAAAIVAFTKALAKQLAKKGIRVNAVAPGPVWTPLQISGGQPPDKTETFGSQTPMGRPGQPAELGPIYAFLASPVSSYATGQVYGAAGGSGNP